MKDLLIELVRFILAISCAVLIFLTAVAFLPSNEPIVIDSGQRIRSIEDLKRAMRFHGIQIAKQDEDGVWYFVRDNKKCKVFKECE